MEEAQRELQDIDSRKANITVFAVDECDDTNIDTRKQYDRECIDEIFQTIGTSDASVLSIIRIGKAQKDSDKNDHDDDPEKEKRAHVPIVRLENAQQVD